MAPWGHGCSTWTREPEEQPRVDLWSTTQEFLDSDTTLNDALREAFDAYDVDGNGEVSFREFVRLEIQSAIELGDTARLTSAQGQMSIASRESGDNLESIEQTMGFEEFRRCRLEAYALQMDKGKDPWVLTRKELVQLAQEEASRTLSIRRRMSCRYKPGLREKLTELFRLLNRAGGPGITPWEWVLGRRFQKACCPELHNEWMTPQAFAKADESQDGFLQLDEFMDLSFDVLPKVPDPLQLLCTMCENIRDSAPEEMAFTNPVRVFVQRGHKDLRFRTPDMAWRPNGGHSFERRKDMLVPASRVDLEELLVMLRLHLHCPDNVSLDAYYANNDQYEDDDAHSRLLGAVDDNAGDQGDNTSERPTVSIQQEGTFAMLSPDDCRKALNRLSYKKTGHAIFVKNMRIAAKALHEAEHEQVHEHGQRLLRIPGQIWCLDWRAQTLGCLTPPSFPAYLTVGDALIFSVPGGFNSKLDFKFFLDDNKVLSKPVLAPAHTDWDHVLEVGKGPKGRKQDSKGRREKLVQFFTSLQAEKRRGRMTEACLKAHASSVKERGSQRKVEKPKDKDQDPHAHVIFFVHGEGRARMFVEIGWEKREADVALQHNVTCPCSDLSVARIGPLILDAHLPVQEKDKAARRSSAPSSVPGLPKEAVAVWWHGKKWSPEPPKVKIPSLSSSLKKRRPTSAKKAGGKSPKRTSSPRAQPKRGRSSSFLGAARDVVQEEAPAPAESTPERPDATRARKSRSLAPRPSIELDEATCKSLTQKTRGSSLHASSLTTNSLSAMRLEECFAGETPKHAPAPETQVVKLMSERLRAAGDAGHLDSAEDRELLAEMEHMSSMVEAMDKKWTQGPTKGKEEMEKRIRRLSLGESGKTDAPLPELGAGADQASDGQRVTFEDPRSAAAAPRRPTRPTSAGGYRPASASGSRPSRPREPVGLPRPSSAAGPRSATAAGSNPEFAGSLEGSGVGALAGQAAHNSSPGRKGVGLDPPSAASTRAPSRSSRPASAAMSHRPSSAASTRQSSAAGARPSSAVRGRATIGTIGVTTARYALPPAA